MLSSRKTLEPRSLQSSTSRVILVSQSGAGHRPPFSFHRGFFWGSKHKNATIRAGKVCKVFSTQYFARKIQTRKQLYRSALWGNHHLLRYLPRYAPTRDWRFLSSWGKKPEMPSSLRDNAEANEEEDWYIRWEKQRLRQYDEFMKRVEHDPYTALFGNSWLNLGGENTKFRAAKTSSSGSSKGTSVPKDEKTPEFWPSKTKSSSMNVPENSDLGGRQSKNETTSTQQHDQEYDIDPITNRKVLKASASPVSTSGHTKSQVTDGKNISEHVFKRRILVPPTPLNHRFVMVEDAQVLSSSDSPGKDTPPLEPRTSKGWLAHEGFAASQEVKGESQPLPQTRDAKPNYTATRIESALDRHLGSKSTIEKRKTERPQLQYRPEENKTEDVDLLRSSDVRASAGLRGNPPKESDVDKQARRMKLEENYESCHLDRVSPSTREAASDKNVQKRADRSVQKTLAPELRFGSWLKETLQDAKLKATEASKSTSAMWTNELSDARDSDPVTVDQTSDSTPLSKKEIVSEPSNAGALEAHNEVKNKVSRLKAQIVPFKAKLDAMKADYDFLRQEWLLEIRRLKEKAAKKEERLKAEKVAKRANEIHEEEIKAQKVAMEAMEMRSSDRNNSMAKSASAKGTVNDDAEKPAPRRLQSFLHGEGDVASNVHEFAGRERWYKRKAPHAMDAKDAEMDTELHKLARDRALIREVRGIYEDTYGTIDTKHRQPHGLSNTSIDTPSEPITSSSERVAPHTQLPSSAAGKTRSSKGLNKLQVSDTLAIIQKLFGQLRDAQSIIQDCQTQTKQALDPNDQDTNIFEPPPAFDISIMQIIRTSMLLGRLRYGNLISQGSIERFAASSTETFPVKRLPTTTAIKSTEVEVQKAAQFTTYCILAYDPTTESVKSVEATSLAPISKEESLLPLDALNRLSNPGKFLPHAISLGGQGYEPVSSTANILVFKKKVAPQNPAKTNQTDASKERSPIRDSLDSLPLSADGFVGQPTGNRPFDPNVEGGIQQLREMGAEQQKIEEARNQAVEIIEKKLQKVEKTGKTAIDSITKEKPPIEEAQQHHSGSSASPKSTSNDTIHRQETVFSGSRQGRWIDNSVKSKRSKRAAGRRRKTVNRMLMAGAFTAVCCYCVGVASEIMHSW